MRNRFLTLAFLLCLVGTASEAQAQSRFGVQASFADDADFGVGARLALAPPAGSPVRIMASFDWFFPDAPVDYWELNGNVVYMVPVVNSAVAPYVGGGLNVAHVSVDGGTIGSSDTDMGLNLLGGMEFGGQLPLYLEARVEISGGEQFVITGGFYF